MLSSVTERLDGLIPCAVRGGVLRNANRERAESRITEPVGHALDRCRALAREPVPILDPRSRISSRSRCKQRVEFVVRIAVSRQPGNRL